jgi:hypothetical protein
MIYDRAEQIEAYLDLTGCDWEQVEAAIDRLSEPDFGYAEPVTNGEPVSARFKLVFWVVTISLLLGSITGYAIGMSARPHTAKAYHPAPFDCASILAAGQGAAIYPLCNQWQTHDPGVTP